MSYYLSSASSNCPIQTSQTYLLTTQVSKLT